MERSKTYRFTLPVFAGEPVDPEGKIAMYREWVAENNRRTAAGLPYFGLAPKMRLRVRGRLGRNNPFTKLIDFRGARDIDLMYAQRCDVYVEVRA